MKVIYNILVKI